MEKLEKKVSYDLFYTFFDIYLHCFFHPTKLEYLFLCIFGCVSCQTVHPKTKINIIRAIFNYGKFKESKNKVKKTLKDLC